MRALGGTPFIRNGGNYFLTDLLIYADGMVDCWGLETLEGFAGKLASGWVATDLPEGAQASAHHLASWKFAEPKSWLTPEMLLGEVRNDIDNLNGRPDSTGRCFTAVDVFREQPTEANRIAVREAYEAIPEHLRRYALGDMDRKDFPLRVIVTGRGTRSSCGTETPSMSPARCTPPRWSTSRSASSYGSSTRRRHRRRVD